MTQAFLAELEQAATAAHAAEMQFRSSIATEIARLERQRQFAFRRVELGKAMAHAVRHCETEAAAVGAQLDALQGECGFHGGSDTWAKVQAAWRPVAEAVWSHRASTLTAAEHAASDPVPPGDVGAALRDFEAWYEAEFGKPFLALLDHEIPEMPVVEM